MAKYSVNNIYPCIQGEGVMTGVPMLLVRLQGCAVGCSFCDTKETWSLHSNNHVATLEEAIAAPRKFWTCDSDELVDEIVGRMGALKWVMLTGGEPANYDLFYLVAPLQRLGISVALETSGTAEGHLGAELDWVCVSPKINMAGGLPLLSNALFEADEIKFVIGDEEDVEKLNAFLVEFKPLSHVVICVQPMSAQQEATQLCVTMAKQMNWRLSIQIHKVIGEQ